MNFQTIINELVEVGMTHTEIARNVGVTQGRIWQLANRGGSVSYDLGARIVDLYNTKTQQVDVRETLTNA